MNMMSSVRDSSALRAAARYLPVVLVRGLDQQYPTGLIGEQAPTPFATRGNVAVWPMGTEVTAEPGADLVDAPTLAGVDIILTGQRTTGGARNGA
jgi:hypothetical protein